MLRFGEYKIGTREILFDFLQSMLRIRNNVIGMICDNSVVFYPDIGRSDTQLYNQGKGTLTVKAFYCKYILLLPFKGHKVGKKNISTQNTSVDTIVPFGSFVTSFWFAIIPSAESLVFFLIICRMYVNLYFMCWNIKYQFFSKCSTLVIVRKVTCFFEKLQTSSS